MWNLFAILALVATTTGDVTATKVDGSTVSGPLTSWSDGRVTLATPSGPAEIAEEQLVSVLLSPSTPAAYTGPLVELVDGSLLPTLEFQPSGNTARLRLDIPGATEQQTIDVPLEQIRAVRLQAIPDDIADQWQEIRDTKSPSDMLIITKRLGKSLDYLEGVVEEVTPTDVAFKLDDDKVRVGRDKVAGIVYFRAVDSDKFEPHCILLGDNGLRIAAKSVSVESDVVRVATAAGATLNFPLADIRFADLSAGKVVFLSDLPPVSAVWHPLVSMPAGASYAAKFGHPKIDRSAAGGPLTLSFPDTTRSDGVGRIEKFNKGLALRSRTEYVVRVPSGYSRFLAVAGIEPTTQANGNVMLSIYGDDRVLMESPVAGNSAPLPIELDVTGVKRLRFVVDYGQNLDTGDWLNLCNARIVK